MEGEVPTIQDYSKALYGRVSANYLAETLKNKDGNSMNISTVKNYVRNITPTPQYILDQLNQECEKRVKLLLDTIV